MSLNMEQMLKNLQGEYLASLPEKITTIKTHIDQSDYSQLINDFHKLKGTGKTYGIPEISELAAAVESICHKQPSQASLAAAQALPILSDIQRCRVRDAAFELEGDPRFVRILKIG